MEPIETTEPLVPGEPTGILLTEEAQYYLHEAGKWARFLGIMGFIGSGLVALVGLFFGSIMSVLSQLKQQQSREMPAAFGVIVAILYLIIALVCFYVSLKLYQFGDGAKDGVEYKNADQVSKALGKLKSFFKIKGIILICVLSLYVLIIIGVAIGASMMHRY